MKKVLSICVLVVISIHGFAIDKAKIFNEAEASYKANQFDQAIRLYESIVETGEVSVALHYNLGNAYFKRGDWGKAILNYERALKLDPGDEDTKVNLQMVNSKITDEMNSSRKGINNWFLKTINILPADQWSRLGVYLISISSALLILCFFISKFKRTAKITGVIGLSFGFIFAIAGLVQYFIFTSENKAILLTPSVEIKSEPADNSKTLFLLHEGTKVKVHDSNEQWIEISVDNSALGWIKKTDLEII